MIMKKDVSEYTLQDWAREYRHFVSRQKKFGTWPFASEAERKKAWEII